MADITIVPYCPDDDRAAIELEEQCPQGGHLSIRFLRPTFRARSEVYEDFSILCAKVAGEVVGTIARADKSVKLHGETIRASYIYDLRVHPAHRKYGTAKRLVDAVLEDVKSSADCIYSFVAGYNENALRFARRCLGTRTVVPLTYAVIPVYRSFKAKGGFRASTAREVHELYLKLNADMQFVPPFYEKGLLGHVASLTLDRVQMGGCSIWTNENLLTERVAKIPIVFRLVRVLTRLCSPFQKLPFIPGPGEIVKSWILFDLYASDVRSVRGILEAVNNMALERGRTFLYILLQPNDKLLKFVMSVGFRVFTFPYFFLAKGRVSPMLAEERIYIDVRDL
ncbi:MAG: GNAT family N-acetyltransferase [Nitrospirae bacterium]|nr:GNAT family N-acetyltransferase [Nitrospirota bacterium]MCL5422205.1 GNAT family N-acetyltransferase [Nitrospirota bacterium]